MVGAPALAASKCVGKMLEGLRNKERTAEDSMFVDFTVTNYAQFRTQASKALEDAFPTYTFKFNIDPDYA